jgi:hypothetical protein
MDSGIDNVLVKGGKGQNKNKITNWPFFELSANKKK